MKKHHIKADDNLNPVLKKEAGQLRGCIIETAEKQSIPDKFKVEFSDITPSVTIIDTKTNKKTSVPLFAYGEVREALNNLFG